MTIEVAANGGGGALFADTFADDSCCDEEGGAIAEICGVEWSGANTVSTAAQEATVELQEGSLRRMSSSWGICDETRRELGAFLRGVTEEDKNIEDVTAEGRSLRNKKLICELVRRERRNVLLKQRQQHIGLFLV